MLFWSLFHTLRDVVPYPQGCCSIPSGMLLYAQRDVALCPKGCCILHYSMQHCYILNWTRHFMPRPDYPVECCPMFDGMLHAGSFHVVLIDNPWDVASRITQWDVLDNTSRFPPINTASDRGKQSAMAWQGWQGWQGWQRWQGVAFLPLIWHTERASIAKSCIYILCSVCA